MRIPQILVIGSSEKTGYESEPYSIGKYIASKNYVLITGGRSGIMEAVSKGAYEEKGTVIGILPGDNLEKSNEYCSIVIPTGVGYARNLINVLSADLVIALGGKAGTLSELAYAWLYKKPIICCTFADGWSRKFPETKIDDRVGSVIYSAKNVDEVYRYIDGFNDI
ncbi:TIGR00725 family protein [Spirochaetota bacterium]